MALQQVGNVKYIGWYVTVPCSPELIPELRKLHSLMQCELKDWKEMVRAARRQHYELNYFTTPQLLSLRQELGHLTSSSSVDLQVIALLQSISPRINVQSIRSALQRVVGKAVTSRQEIEPQQQAIGLPPLAVNENESISQSQLSPPRWKVKTQDKEQSPKTMPQTSTAQLCEETAPEQIKQKELLDNIVHKYGKRFEPLVLQAFREGIEGQVEAENWVMDNIKQCGEGQSDDEEEEEEEASSEEEVGDEENATNVSSADMPLQNTPLSKSGKPYLWI